MLPSRGRYLPPPIFNHTPSSSSVGPGCLSLPQVAAGANLVTFSLYGSGLLFTPSALMKGVMRSDAPASKFGDIPFAISQFLGAVYLAQALRILLALTGRMALRSELLGVGIVQLFLCVTSLARLAGGIDRNAVTVSLPVGQGLMGALSFAGMRAAASICSCA